jgi:hypothetical protein
MNAGHLPRYLSAPDDGDHWVALLFEYLLLAYGSANAGTYNTACPMGSAVLYGRQRPRM